MGLPGHAAANTVEEWAQKAFAVYLDNVASRLPRDGTSEEDRLEREGRGWTAFEAKWRAAFQQVGSVIAEEAKKPKEEPRRTGPAENRVAGYTLLPFASRPYVWLGPRPPAAPSMAL